MTDKPKQPHRIRSVTAELVPGGYRCGCGAEVKIDLPSSQRIVTGIVSTCPSCQITWRVTVDWQTRECELRSGLLPVPDADG